MCVYDGDDYFSVSPPVIQYTTENKETCARYVMTIRIDYRLHLSGFKI